MRDLSLLFRDYSIKCEGTTRIFTEKLHFPTQMQKNARINSAQRGLKQQLLFPFPEKNEQEKLDSTNKIAKTSKMNAL